MGKPSTRFLKAINRLSKSPALKEGVKTEALSRWLYHGHGEKYLSLPPCEDGVGRSPNANPRRFSCPTKSRHYARWLPLRDHITGDRKGIVADKRTKKVPFISVDIDRHSSSVSSNRHQQLVVAIGRYLCCFPHIKWIAEVNPNNGSTKFFGFRRAGDHFLLSDAQKIASHIKQELIERNLCHNGNIEVFPDNCKAVFLPLRRDKISIADRGILPRCVRKMKDERVFGETVWEYYRSYSILHFINWIYQGDNYSEPALISALRFSCAGMPDDMSIDDDVSIAPSKPVVARSPAGSGLANQRINKAVTRTDSKGQSDPSAFSRNWSALLPFVREFFKLNKTFPSVSEALHYLKENDLYSGDWSDNERHRRARVTDILNKIQETFDPSLLKSHQKVTLDPGIRRWCRRQFPNGITGKQRQINEVDMTSVVKDIRVPGRFVEYAVGVIAFCLNDPLENYALPINRIKAVWDLVPNTPSWNQKYFQVVRRHLEKIGVVDIYDKNHCTGKAWRWRKGENFPQKMKQSRRSICSNESRSCKLSEIKSLCETSRAMRLSTGGAREWGGKGVEKEYTHNSLYHLPLQNPVTTIRNSHYRGPPRSKGPDWHLTLSNSLN
ncbi:hypothetical protein [Bremerella alba]|uniref:Uncharacterized protein n=1 Tax=Bremerella alba TaxID=980252 RepID=A0A7V8V878_9BACT|nr:hypothetical protein [Bremerella alba]MBA2116733.1 hypothetical protein [Bremerella alba]